MAEKDVDEQFAAIMAHWDDVALGLDPYGDPHPDLAPDPTVEPTEGDPPADAPIARAPEIRRIRDVADLPDLTGRSLDEIEGRLSEGRFRPADFAR